jgi:hypothetical protein
MDNVVSFSPKDQSCRRIRAALTAYEGRQNDFIDAMLELAAALAEGRALFPADLDFSVWLAKNHLDGVGHQDRAALISIAKCPEHARNVAVETQSRSVRMIWAEMGHRVTSAGKPPVQPTLVAETPKETPVKAPTATTTRDETAISEALTDPVETLPTTPAELYPLPGKSKLRELIGNSADVLHGRFKHSRMFAHVQGVDSEAGKAIMRFLAKRCQEADYPVELFTAERWSLSILWPHLPKKLLDQMPSSMPALKKQVTALHEVEARFVKTPEFGMTDPPMAAFNKASAIFNSVLIARKGGSFDPSHRHTPTFDGDEGKPPVIIAGTQVWPAASGSGYSYADLRCAIGVTDDILRTFKETGDVSDATKSLKLRHVMSWLPGGYNAVGNTLEGTHKALTAVVQAYSAAKSTEMRFPPPSLAKADGNEK